MGLWWFQGVLEQTLERFVTNNCTCQFNHQISLRHHVKFVFYTKQRCANDWFIVFIFNKEVFGTHPSWVQVFEYLVPWKTKTWHYQGPASQRNQADGRACCGCRPSGRVRQFLPNQEGSFMYFIAGGRMQYIRRESPCDLGVEGFLDERLDGLMWGILDFKAFAAQDAQRWRMICYNSQ